MKKFSRKDLMFIFIGIFILLLRFDFFNSKNDVFLNPPTWLGVLFPLLSIQKYDISYISILATILCFFMIPAILSMLVYLLLSATSTKKVSLKKNPYKNAKNNDIFNKIYREKPAEPNVTKVLKNRMHSVVWIQVACFAGLFILLIIWGAVQGTIKLEEVGMGVFCVILVAPAYSIVLYLLRWIEYRLYMPIDKLIDAMYKKRIKSPLNDIKEREDRLSRIVGFDRT